MSRVVLYRCDFCTKEDRGFNRKLPGGWKTIRWVPGVITPPYGSEEFERAERMREKFKDPKHACGDAGCQEKLRAEAES